MGGAAVDTAPAPTRATPATAPSSRPARVPDRRRLTRISRLVADTPGRLRTTAVALGLCIIVLGAVAAITVDGRAAATARIRDESGPLLIAAQELSSSFAEADTLATSTFLGGAVEDRAQRRQYEGALARIAELLEQAARTAGDDPATHDLLAQLQSRSITYAGLVERARAIRDGDADAAVRVLVDAAAFRHDRLDPLVVSLADRAHIRLDADERDASGSGALLMGALLAMVAATVACQWFLARRFRRVFNLPLLAGTCLLVAGTAWSSVATSRQAADLDRATTAGLDTVSTIASTRSTAYALQGDLTAGLITAVGVPTDLERVRGEIASRPLGPDDIDRARAGEAGFDGQLATLARRPRDVVGRALAAEVLARWQRFDAVVVSIAAEPDPAIASQLASTVGAETFTGFNVSIDALLAADRDAVIDDVSRSADRLDHLTLALLVIAACAAMLSASGLAQRVREYR